MQCFIKHLNISLSLSVAFSPELCVKKKTPGQFATSHPTPHRDECGVKSGVTVATAYFKMEYMVLCSN